MFKKVRKEVVILVIAHKEVLTDNEIISLKQLYKVLGSYPIKFICPEGLNVSLYQKCLPNPEFDFIDPWWQATYENFNKLKMNSLLYKKYKEYNYILYYEPDAYVFKDELMFWCSKGYDYIGAPWFEGWNKANSDSDFKGVGNGGFSLRKTSSALEIWSLKNYYKIRKSNKVLFTEFKERNKSLNWFKKLGSFKYFIFQLFGKRNNTKYSLSQTFGNEDVFWTSYIPEYFPNYKVASFEEAYAFSFETNPSLLYKKNNDKLPFGCHAWEKYEYEEFWKKYIN